MESRAGELPVAKTNSVAHIVVEPEPGIGARTSDREQALSFG